MTLILNPITRTWSVRIGDVGHGPFETREDAALVRDLKIKMLHQHRERIAEQCRGAH